MNFRVFKKKLKDAARSNKKLETERRNSLAALSNRMFKQMVDIESEHYNNMDSLEKQIEDKDILIQEKNTLIKEKDTTIQQNNTTIQQKNDTIKQKDTLLEKKDTVIQQKDTAKSRQQCAISESLKNV